MIRFLGLQIFKRKVSWTHLHLGFKIPEQEVLPDLNSLHNISPNGHFVVFKKYISIGVIMVK